MYFGCMNLCRFITINELMQVPGPWVAEVKVFVP